MNQAQEDDKKIIQPLAGSKSVRRHYRALGKLRLIVVDKKQGKERAQFQGEGRKLSMLE